MRNGLLLSFTEKVRDELATRLRGKPAEELDAWLRIALERESMVTRIYKPLVLEGRKKSLLAHNDAGAVKAVINAVLDVWTVEEKHMSYLRAVRSLTGSAIRNALWGKLQGEVIANLTSRSRLRSTLGMIAIGAARLLKQQAPDFPAEMRRLGMKTFCELNEELEETAVKGYERILDLLDDLGKKRIPDLPTIEFHLSDARLDEIYHKEVFAKIKSWFVSENVLRKSLTYEKCQETIFEIARSYYELPEGLYVPRGVRAQTARTSKHIRARLRAPKAMKRKVPLHKQQPSETIVFMRDPGFERLFKGLRFKIQPERSVLNQWGVVSMNALIANTSRSGIGKGGKLG